MPHSVLTVVRDTWLGPRSTGAPDPAISISLPPRGGAHFLLGTLRWTGLSSKIQLGLTTVKPPFLQHLLKTENRGVIRIYKHVKSFITELAKDVRTSGT